MSQELGFSRVYVGLTTPVQFAAWPPDLWLLPGNSRDLAVTHNVANFGPQVTESIDCTKAWPPSSLFADPVAFLPLPFRPSAAGSAAGNRVDEAMEGMWLRLQIQSTYKACASAGVVTN